MSDDLPAGDSRSQDRPALPVILTGLCFTQIIAWGILYYAFPVLSARITEDTGWSTSLTTFAYTAGLIISALLGIPVGKILDRRGPRAVMSFGSVAGAVGLGLVGWSPHYWIFFSGWLLAGAGMAGTLYPPAFAAVTRWYGPRRVFALTMITLIGGLASTVFAPVTESLAEFLDWRGVYIVLAISLGAVTLPVHVFVLRRPWPAEYSRTSTSRSQAEAEASEQQNPEHRREDSEEIYAQQVMRSPAYLLMTIGLSLGALSMFAAMINLVPMLVDRGVSSSLAAWILGLGGLGQVIGRLFYWLMERRMSVRSRTLWVYGLLAVSAGLLALDITHGIWLVVISMLAGVGRGISTLLKATAVTDRWGPRAYGRLSGVFNAPVMFAIAVAPFTGAVLADLLGSWEAMYLVMAGIGGLAMIALIFSVPRGQLSARSSALGSP